MLPSLREFSVQFLLPTVMRLQRKILCTNGRDAGTDRRSKAGRSMITACSDQNLIPFWMSKSVSVTRRRSTVSKDHVGVQQHSTHRHSLSGTVLESSGKNLGLVMCLLKFSYEKILVLIPIFVLHSQFSF